MRFVSLIRTGARVNPLSPVESERVESRGQAFRAFRYLLVSLWANNTFWNKLAVTSIGGVRTEALSSFFSRESDILSEKRCRDFRILCNEYLFFILDDCDFALHFFYLGSLIVDS